MLACAYERTGTECNYPTTLMLWSKGLDMYSVCMKHYAMYRHHWLDGGWLWLNDRT